MATRSARCSRSSQAAATATLLNRQKPMAWVGVAWWPGGRTRHSAFRARLAVTASVASTNAPAAALTQSPNEGDVLGGVHQLERGVVYWRGLEVCHALPQAGPL